MKTEVTKTVVYIAGPYRADTINGIFENIQRARSAALRLWKCGYIVICPHMNTAFMDGDCPDEIWLDGDLEILSRCDYIYMLDGWNYSEGAIAEFRFAEAHNIPILREADVRAKEREVMLRLSDVDRVKMELAK